MFSIISLSGCCLKHKWVEATCDFPMTCSVCGKTEGEPIGHRWIEATCTTPKTCSVCGVTEGNPLPHTWVEATCTEAKTCSVCGKKEGEALGHEWTFTTVDAPKTCTRCSLTDGEPIKCEEIIIEELIKDDYDNHCFLNESIVGYTNKNPEFSIFDYDGKEIKKINIVKSNYKSWSYDLGYQTDLKNDVCFVTTLFDQENKGTIILYDQFGKELATLNTKLSFTGYLKKDEVIDERYILLSSSDTKKVILCIDTETMSFVDKENIRDDLDYDKEKYGCCYPQKNLNYDLYLVSNLDKSAWGYVDKDFNEVAMYADASDFNAGGYALVSKDLKTYDIIDSDFNVVGKGCIEGESSWLSGGYVLAVLKDEEVHYYMIK